MMIRHAIVTASKEKAEMIIEEYKSRCSRDKIIKYLITQDSIVLHTTTEFIFWVKPTECRGMRAEKLDISLDIEQSLIKMFVLPMMVSNSSIDIRYFEPEALWSKT